MRTAQDDPYPNHWQAEWVADPDVATTKKPEAPRSRVQPPGSNGLGGIAHDFNNVLNSILMSARLLQMGRPEPEKHRLVNIIQASAERGAAMVKGLLALADHADGPTNPCQDRFLRAG
jgi:two-component system cell cycle sensor histidine kinase/response regulator CckA